MDKVRALNKYGDDWNENEIPEELIEKMFDLALYDAQSLNKFDQYDQRNIWIALHENTKTYTQNC